MSVREWMNNNSALVTIIAVVVLVISLGIVIWNMGGGSRNRIVGLYYYDLNTGRIFVSSGTEIPPVETESGPHNGAPAGVRAHIFACGECPTGLDGMTPEQVQQAGATVAYLETYPLQAKQILSDPNVGGPGGAPPEAMSEAAMATMVRTLNSERWVPLHGPGGMQVMEAISQRCPDGSSPRGCQPR